MPKYLMNEDSYTTLIYKPTIETLRLLLDEMEEAGCDTNHPLMLVQFANALGSFSIYPIKTETAKANE